MSGKAFFDTNMLVYAVSQADPKGEIVRTLIRKGGTISVQVLNEFVNVARKKRKIDWPEIHAVIANFRLTLRVVPVTIETHERGLRLTQNHSFALYDAMIVAAAELAECSVLYSEDMQAGFVTGGVMLRNPFT